MRHKSFLCPQDIAQNITKLAEEASDGRMRHVLIFRIVNRADNFDAKRYKVNYILTRMEVGKT